VPLCANSLFESRGFVRATVSPWRSKILYLVQASPKVSTVSESSHAKSELCLISHSYALILTAFAFQIIQSVSSYSYNLASAI
jgi:hypothetical protein